MPKDEIQKLKKESEERKQEIPRYIIGDIPSGLNSPKEEKTSKDKIRIRELEIEIKTLKGVNKILNDTIKSMLKDIADRY